MSLAHKVNPQIEIKLTVLKGPHAGQSFVLNKQSFSIGRGPENEIILLNDAKISRQHAKIQVVNQDIEILNLSSKNQIFVGTESIQKWKLTNDSVFKIGDSEIKIDYDLGQAAVVVTKQPIHKSLAVVKSLPIEVTSASSSEKTHITPQAPELKPSVSQVQLQQNQLPQTVNTGLTTAQSQYPAQAYHQAQYPTMPPQQQHNMQYQQAAVGYQQQGKTSNKAVQPKDFLSDPKARFYLVVGLVLLALVYWLNDTPKAKKNKEIKSTLKYEDDFTIKQNSLAEKELEQKRKKQFDLANSPTYLRVQENFQKGMRDFNLANYARAIDYFQVVLNLDPNHAQARRQLFLAKARFDEVLKAKLILGESYYQKHNFKMCEAMYQQVIVMLQGKSNDRSYQIAQSMIEKCRLASEGIR